MAVKRLDGPGLAKMATLEEATLLFQRLHGLVEQYALAIQRSQPASQIMMNLRRQLPSLADMLKAQFGAIGDAITTLNTQITRGGSEQVRVRQMREGMAMIRNQLELAMAQTVAKHEVKEAQPDTSESA